MAEERTLAVHKYDGSSKSQKYTVQPIKLHVTYRTGWTDILPHGDGHFHSTHDAAIFTLGNGSTFPVPFPVPLSVSGNLKKTVYIPYYDLSSSQVEGTVFIQVSGGTIVDVNYNHAGSTVIYKDPSCHSPNINGRGDVDGYGTVMLTMDAYASGGFDPFGLIIGKILVAVGDFILTASDGRTLNLQMELTISRGVD